MNLSQCRSLARDYSTSALLLCSFAANIGLAFALYHERDLYRGNTKDKQVGAIMSSFEAKEVGGRTVTVDPESELPTILYVFGVHCKYCERNLENSNALASLTNGRYRFIAVSVDGGNLAEYVKTKHLSYRTLSVDRETAIRMRFTSTPKTYALSKRGEVLQAWTGAWGLSNKPRVEKYFGIKLPQAAESGVSSAQ